MKTPAFWYKQPSFWLKILSPLGWPYAAVTELKQKIARPYKAGIPVICIGNLTVGGTGKTPVVMELVRMIQNMDHNPHILTRGYGGNLRYGMVEAKHDAKNVGDEALLLKKAGQVWIGKDRGFTAGLAEKMGACCLVMDDGFQNTTLHKDLNIIVIDGNTGFGNGMALPLGPLRETIENGLRRVHAVILIGDDKTNVKSIIPQAIPVIRADFSLHPADMEVLKGQKVIAFAGLGRPEKFKMSLEENSVNIIHFESFADHHFYTDAELQKLKMQAERENAILVTTEKDFVRLSVEQQKNIMPNLMYVRGELKFQKPEQFAQILYPLLAHSDN